MPLALPTTLIDWPRYTPVITNARKPDTSRTRTLALIAAH